MERSVLLSANLIEAPHPQEVNYLAGKEAPSSVTRGRGIKARSGTIFRVLPRGLRNGARAESFSHTICTVVSTKHFFLLDQSKNKKIYIHDTAKPTKKSVAAGKRGKKAV